MLRTNILFSRKDPTFNTMTVVSAGAGEGKSTTLFNLATTFAQNGARVLVVDSDLRRPSIHKIINVSNSLGLTNFLLNQNTLEEVIQRTSLASLDVLPSGKLPSSSMGILSSPQMKALIGELKRRYDEMAPQLAQYGTNFLPLQHTGVAIATRRGSLVVRWLPEFSNSLQDATLSVEIYDGYVSIGDRRAAREGKVINKCHYTPSFDVGHVWRWIPKDLSRRYRSDELLENLLKQLFESVFRD